MHDFQYHGDELWCEELAIRAIAEKVGTPFYLYSHNTLKRHFRVFDDAFAGQSHIVCFAAKANSNIAVLRIFIREGGGVDIVSGGELYRALLAGADPGKVVYSGVGKRIDEIDYALTSGILLFNVESFAELETIQARAKELGKKAGIALRINPDVDPQTHPYISTGLKENKFGIDIGTAVEAYRKAAGFANLDVIGVSCHIGSQVTKVSPFVDALGRLQVLVRKLREEGMGIRYLDLGGGLGITYREETPPLPAEYAAALLAMARDLDCTLILEPGRVIVGNAGILVTKALYTKATGVKNFVVVDAGMNDLIRPSLYDSYHRIQSIVRRDGGEIEADIVGPICESGDYLARKRRMPAFQSGDLIAVMSAGAYGFTMSSNYNSRPRVAEVLVEGDRFHVIRERETYADLIRGERIPPFLLSE
ncbi:MAG: diaminopimelate decarboxylase [Syntrophales bacterium]|jgi:diaminopimelate decarboxylase|nr:diaminopimelate decarboxylase [Syntrophales bacterium]